MHSQIKESARGLWSQILMHTAGLAAEQLSGKHGPCPICGGKDRFRFDDRDGTGSFYCNNCGAGDGFKLLMLLRKCSFPEASASVASCLGRSQTRTRASLEDAILKVWDESAHLSTASSALKYLASRINGFAIAPECLRFHSHLQFFDGDHAVVKSPAIVAPVTKLDGRIVTLHRTYITSEGAKAFGAKSKKLMPAVFPGACSGAAIKLFAPGYRLGLCEGIETALAAQIATDIPTWATVSASLMPKVEIPKTVTEIVIFADNDENQAGQTAAAKTANRLVNEGFQVKIVIPPIPGTDWLDVWNEAHQ
jgi:putative DNA primase/helicase